MRDIVHRIVDFAAETLAFFATALFTIWVIRRLRNAAFISLVASLALAGSGPYPTCGRRRAVS
jgi:hypothetical protein